MALPEPHRVDRVEHETSKAEMDKDFPTLMRHLKQTGMLWVSRPKAKQLCTDLSLPHVIRIGFSMDWWRVLA